MSALCAACLAVTLITSPATQVHEAEDARPIELAKALIADGQTGAARLVLQRRPAAPEHRVEILFLLGMIAVSENDLATAVKRFREALVHEPDTPRIRLEFARALYLKRDYENAFRQFQFARAGNPPTGVITTIDRYLAAIRREKSWSYSASLAVAPDSNINQATSARETSLFGLPFELGDDARRRSGLGIAIDGSAELAPRLSRDARVRLGASVQRHEYKGERFDDMTLALHAGPRLMLRRWDISFLGTGSARFYGGKRYNGSLGARVEAIHNLRATAAVAIGVSAQRMRYADAPAYDGTSIAAWGGILRALNPSSTAQLKLGIVRHAARMKNLANWSGIAGVNYYRDLAGGMSGEVEANIWLARHDLSDPFFSRRRRDLGQRIGVSLLNRRVVILSRFTPRITYAFARRRSSIKLHDFEQNRLEIGVTSVF